ncbi:MAG TPA: SMP-30/gluconolactonase/LRE family protein [Nocardioides sp.]|jgi:sugar lactone lactonase YvrE|uniref:SMP-30/gluconolactonase/LRE family protein n=1 Tax=Nocardioides sp. TaxID=35761 RepID=UPI002E2F420B|nr:SMP-30/gluconolactonase/LRE family protein [Nocardioides sp.]HEX3929107.1 SMP-30/gluconolactonase/LRE family protein [Nocardioides sp.]
MDVLCSGYGLVESPRWHDGRLWFSDWTGGQVVAVDDAGATEVVLEHRSLPMCFDFLPDGRLVLVSNQERGLLTLEADGSLATYADLSSLSSYGCNDIVVDGQGRVFVNSPDFDFASGPPPGEVQPGLIGVVSPDGEARAVAGDIAFPNGMAVSADGSTLVVADSYRSQLVGFDIAADGSLSGRRVWADLPGAGLPGANRGGDNPDGICLDADGAAWYADVPHRRCVRVAEGGEVLASVELDRGGFACMLGGTDRPYLYAVCAVWPGAAGLMTHTEWDGQVVRIPVDVAGAGWPAR